MKSIRCFVVAFLFPFIAFSSDYVVPEEEQEASCCCPQFLKSFFQSASSASSVLLATVKKEDSQIDMDFDQNQISNLNAALSSGIVYDVVDKFELVFQTVNHDVSRYHDSTGNDFNYSDKIKGDTFTLRGFAYRVNTFDPTKLGTFVIPSQGAGSFGTVVVKGTWEENVKLGTYPPKGELVATGEIMVILNSGDPRDFFTLPFKMTMAQTADDRLPMFDMNFTTSSASGRNYGPGNNHGTCGKADVFYKGGNIYGASFLFRIQRESGKNFVIPRQ